MECDWSLQFPEMYVMRVAQPLVKLPFGPEVEVLLYLAADLVADKGERSVAINLRELGSCRCEDGRGRACEAPCCVVVPVWTWSQSYE